MNIKKYISIAVFSVFIFSSTSALAQPVSETIRQTQDKREELEVQIQDMDVEIEETMDKIEEYKNEIVKTEAQIKNTEVEVENAEEELKLQQDILDKRIRVLYKNGQVSYLNMIIKAENFNDLLSAVVNINRIIDYDRQLMDENEAKKQQLNDKKQELVLKKQEIQDRQKESENRVALIQEKSKEQKVLIEELKSQERTFAASSVETQEALNNTLAQVVTIRNNTPKYVPSRGSAEISNDVIIAYASNFLGTPYLWGGTLPSTGFDCSGFTKYVYAHFGISLGRTTKDQIKNGYGVSKGELQTGDLVFFGKAGIPNHMGIYVGNNTYIHSPQTGDVIKISPMTRSDFITGRRVK